MKPLLLLPFFFFAVFAAKGQEVNPNYDPSLARQLGADDYGMKSYVLVILKTGSNTTEVKAIRDSLFAGHMNNIGRLAKLGKLVVAGPLAKNEKSYRGIFILSAASFDEANELLMTDPAIKEKIFETELYKWYGSAALPEYLQSHEKIEKLKIK